MAVSKVEIQDDAGNVFHPHTEAAVVFFKDGSSAEQNITLNASCAYASSVYTLTIPNAPAAYPSFFTVRFKAPNAYVANATFKIGSDVYTPKIVSFDSGDVLDVHFDKAAKKCFISSVGTGEVINNISATSGTVALATNRIYKASFNGAVTFSYPTPTTGRLNQIMLYMKITSAISITWGSVLFVGSSIPTIEVGKNYRVIFEYDPNAAKWCVGAIESGAAS